MSRKLTEEQELIKLMAQDFAKRKIEPHALVWDRDEFFPLEIIKELGSLGFLGMMVPESYGGSNVGAVTYSLVLQQIAYADAGVAVTMSVANLCCEPILMFGSEQQKIAYLIPMASGEKLSSFCLTEPQAGSDAANIKTTARKDGRYYIVDGSKTFITNGSYADIFIVMARTGNVSGSKGLSAFIVEKGTPGLSIGTVEKKMGLRSSNTTEVIFDSCRVSEEQMLGKEGQGFKVAMSALDSGRIGIASQAIGMGRACLDEALEYSKNRVQFGKSISSFQAIQWKLADIATQIHASDLLTWHAAVLKDEKKSLTLEASMAKLFASESLNRITYEALQIFGGYGFMKDYKVEKLFRDARVTTIYEGTSEIQRLVIARELLKQ